MNLNSSYGKKLFLEQMGKTEESFEKDIDIIEEWLKTQKHLPEITSRNRIASFLTINKCSLEIAKKKIDMYYTVLSLMPDVFNKNIHLKLEKMQNIRKSLYYCVLPKLTKDGNRVIIFKLRDRTLFDNVDINELFIFCISMFEIRIAEEQCISDIFVMDHANFTLKDILKISPAMVKKFSFIIEEVYSNRIAGMYLFNSPVVESFLKIMKLFMNPKLVSRIKVYKSLENVFNDLPREIFPRDFGGGQELTLEELNDLWAAKIAEYYDRFDELHNMRVNEDLRPEPLNNDELLGFYGNFKKLDVD